MAEPTGTIHEDFNGKKYALRLTMRSIATLQEAHGNNVAGILDGTSGDIPSFAALLDLVSLALQKGQSLPADQASEIADDMLTADPEIVGRIVQAAFPHAGNDEGNGTGPKAAA